MIQNYLQTMTQSRATVYKATLNLSDTNQRAKCKDCVILKHCLEPRWPENCSHSRKPAACIIRVQLYIWYIIYAVARLCLSLFLFLSLSSLFFGRLLWTIGASEAYEAGLIAGTLCDANTPYFATRYNVAAAFRDDLQSLSPRSYLPSLKRRDVIRLLIPGTRPPVRSFGRMQRSLRDAIRVYTYSCVHYTWTFVCRSA